VRLRRDPKARPELAACEFFIEDPPRHKGGWQELFGNDNPMYLELGCGKGGFISKVGAANAQINYIVIDLKSEVLVHAKRKIEQEYTAAGITEINNVKLMSQDIERIDDMLEATDIIGRIYINFCNPWPKTPDKKKRLTHGKQLMKYKNFLKSGGEIWFKTDNDELFQESSIYFKENGFIIRYTTNDLHASGFEESYPTEHEIMFTKEGIPIKFLIAVNKKVSGSISNAADKII